MIKDIVVQLTGSKEDDVRLAYATDIARAFSAHLTGVQLFVLPEAVTTAHPVASSYLQEVIETARREADAVSERLNAKLADDISRELRRLDVFPGDAGTALASEVRTADLFIGTRPYGDPAGLSHIEEAVLFRSGRGCLFVPPGSTPPARYDTILVAWKNTLEAARAVSEALPFLQQAGTVIVTVVEEGGASEERKLEAGADIGRYLSRHGVSAEIRKVGGWSDSGAAILNEAKQIGAQMIVMGGYGHSRFREWVLGGATRDVLSKSPVPVLIAH